MKIGDLDALKDELLRLGFFPAIVRSAIDRMPTIDAMPVMRGRWIDAREYCGDFMCSNCDALYGTNKFNHCPNCGAKMDLEEKKDAT